MSVTGVSPVPREVLLPQLDKLVNSNVLKGSESLCKLLRYLAERSIDQPGTLLKEFQIATEVFARQADFDPRLDATVRVQTGRLRSKLVEYYASEGAGDSVIFSIPKGSYSLAVHIRVAPETAPVVPRPVPAIEPAWKAEPPVARVSVAAFWVVSVMCAGLISALIYVIVMRPVIQVAAPVAAEAPPAVKTFWHGFIDQPEHPLVVFSNAEFVGRPETGMRYFDPARDSHDSILDHYTGVGEVLAIHELDRVFTLLNHGIRIKRSRLLSLDDAKHYDLIFVGSPSENLPLREIPTTQEFVFRRAERGARKDDLEIVNLNPLPGEDAAYMGSKTVPISEDHSLIGMVPGAYSGRWVMILAGTTTIGTQAAVEYVCRERDIQELLSRVGTSRAGGILPFEAVIRVKVTGGVPVSSQLVALHARDGK